MKDEQLVPRTERAPRRTAFIVTPGVDLLDVTGPLQALSFANEMTWEYDPLITSVDGGLTSTAQGMAIDTRGLSTHDGAAIDTVIVAGMAPSGSRDRQHIVNWLSDRASTTRRICGVGPGVDLLSAAGLLDDRPTAAHWRHARGTEPAEERRARPLLARHAGIWTSAGMTSSVDLALAMIEEDLGTTAALTVAELLIVYVWRPIGHPQISASLEMQIRGGERFSRLHGWISRHLDGDLRVERLAEFSAMAPRTFARVYRREVGVSPALAVERIRLDAAQVQLTTNDAPLKEIARQCGFGSELNLRRSFLRHHGLTPSAYRGAAEEHPDHTARY